MALTGKNMARASGGTLDGARSFVANGFQAAEIHVSDPKLSDAGSAGQTFSVRRSVIAGDAHFLFRFNCRYQSWEAENGGYTSRDNPLLLEYGLPSLDSAAFSLHAETFTL
jgi:hypothetical protein